MNVLQNILRRRGGYFRWLVFCCAMPAICLFFAKPHRANEQVTNEDVKLKIWPSDPPEDCPFLRSTEITGIAFTGRHKEYLEKGGDTWYPSWASDGNLYSPFGDGEADAFKVDGKLYEGGKTTVTTGYAKIVGDNPLDLKVVGLGSLTYSPLPYHARYPSANLVHNGVWYYGTYTLDDLWGTCGWGCVQGPIVGFSVSSDYGKTWANPPQLSPTNNLFRETGLSGGKIKMGIPQFIDFGQNMKYSPDSKAYLVGHGATRPAAHDSVFSGDEIFLVRVTPTPENINDLSKYEFFAGYDPESPRPRWSKNFSDIKPLFDWIDHAGTATITYDAPLKKYLMCVTYGWPTVGTFNTYILEADPEAIVGSKPRPFLAVPWRLVTFMRRFGEQAYFVNIPSKFISADGRTVWLCYTNDYTESHAKNPPIGPGSLVLQEVKLLGPSAPQHSPSNPQQ
jgi:hypothetical protein